MQYEMSQNKTTDYVSINSLIQTKKHNGIGISSPSAATVQAKATNENLKHTGPIQKQANHTGLPDDLKTGVENRSGFSMDDVRVHYNSSKPAQLQALAFTQGTDIHVAPGQEKHLPHEAWHVVQQRQGRVQPTFQMKGMGVGVNDDPGLEREADEHNVIQCKIIKFGHKLQEAEIFPSDVVSKLEVDEAANAALEAGAEGPIVERDSSSLSLENSKTTHCVGHGNTSEFAGLKPYDLAGYLNDKNIPDAQPVFLVACNLGVGEGDSYAQELADRLQLSFNKNVHVTAANGLYHYTRTSKFIFDKDYANKERPTLSEQKLKEIYELHHDEIKIETLKEAILLAEKVKEWMIGVPSGSKKLNPSVESENLTKFRNFLIYIEKVFGKKTGIAENQYYTYNIELYMDRVRKLNKLEDMARFIYCTGKFIGKNNIPFDFAKLYSNVKSIGSLLWNTHMNRMDQIPKMTKPDYNPDDHEPIMVSGPKEALTEFEPQYSRI
jgi:hypothetical protein